LLKKAGQKSKETPLKDRPGGVLSHPLRRICRVWRRPHIRGFPTGEWAQKADSPGTRGEKVPFRKKKGKERGERDCYPGLGGFAAVPKKLQETLAGSSAGERGT